MAEPSDPETPSDACEDWAIGIPHYTEGRFVLLAVRQEEPPGGVVPDEEVRRNEHAQRMIPSRQRFHNERSPMDEFDFDEAEPQRRSWGDCRAELAATAGRG